MLGLFTCLKFFYSEVPNHHDWLWGVIVFEKSWILFKTDSVKRFLNLKIVTLRILEVVLTVLQLHVHLNVPNTIQTIFLIMMQFIVMRQPIFLFLNFHVYSSTLNIASLGETITILLMKHFASMNRKCIFIFRSIIRISKHFVTIIWVYKT